MQPRRSRQAVVARAHGCLCRSAIVLAAVRALLAASSRAVVGLPTDIGTSAARTVGSLAAGPVGCKHPRGKQPPAADRRGRALTSGFAQTQRCGSAEPRQPRDDRIPGERLFRRAPEPAMPMATFRGSASAITGGAATNRFPRWHASTTIARCAQLATSRSIAALLVASQNCCK
jgi:hypothetical protein